MLTRGRARAEELAGVRITRSKASVAHVHVGVMEPELPERAQRKRAARSVRGIAKGAKPVKKDVLSPGVAGNASQINKATSSENPKDMEISQMVRRMKEQTARDKMQAVRSIVSSETVSTLPVSTVHVATVKPIALATVPPRERTLAGPLRTRPLIDRSGIPFDGYVFLDLETNDALKPPRETRILEIAIRVTNEKFEPLDDGFSSLIHWPDMTAEQLRAEMPLKVKEMHRQLMFEYERTPTHQRRTLGQVEGLICQYLERHGLHAGSRQAIMAGAGIAFDRGIVREHMRKLDSYFHFQTCDMTSLWHIVKRRYDRQSRHQNSVPHRAMADIEGSMREAKMYLDLIFRTPDEVQWPF